MTSEVMVLAQKDLRTFFIDGSDVMDGLNEANRLYLVGHLERNQLQLQHISELNEASELGITHYRELTVDQPHLHTSNVDFAFVMEGTYAVRIIPTGEFRVLSKYGLCVIEPGLAHVCVAHPETKVLFVKTPGGNDKVVVELDKESQAWVDAYCESVLE